MRPHPSTKKLDPSMYTNVEDASLPALLVDMGISPEEFEEMRKESDRDPETIALRQLGERFKNGTETAEDRAWLEESEKNSDPNLLTSYHTSP